jgi:hypothetical protein
VGKPLPIAGLLPAAPTIMHGMVAIADRAQKIPFTPAPGARGQRGHSGCSQNFCSNPSDKRPFQRPSPSQQSRLGSCSRDPVGYQGSPWNLYEYVGGRPLVGMDPMGLTLLTQCEDHCAQLYPDWWQYHLYVGCINGCQGFKPTKCWWNCMVQTNKCACTCAANVVAATCVTGFTHF